MQTTGTIIRETVDTLRLDVLLCVLCQNIALVMSGVKKFNPETGLFKVK